MEVSALCPTIPSTRLVLELPQVQVGPSFVSVPANTTNTRRARGVSLLWFGHPNNKILLSEDHRAREEITNSKVLDLVPAQLAILLGPHLVISCGNECFVIAHESHSRLGARVGLLPGLDDRLLVPRVSDDQIPLLEQGDWYTGSISKRDGGVRQEAPATPVRDCGLPGETLNRGLVDPVVTLDLGVEHPLRRRRDVDPALGADPLGLVADIRP